MTQRINPPETSLRHLEPRCSFCGSTDSVTEIRPVEHAAVEACCECIGEYAKGHLLVRWAERKAMRSGITGNLQFDPVYGAIMGGHWEFATVKRKGTKPKRWRRCR